MYEAILKLLDFDESWDNVTMNVCHQDFYFETRGILKKAADVEAEDSPVFDKYVAYKSSFFHGGTKEEIQEYYNARKLLRKSIWES